MRQKIDYERIAALDLPAMTAAQIDDEWQHLMYEEQVTAAGIASGRATLRKGGDRLGEHVRMRIEAGIEEAVEKVAKLKAAQVPFHEVWDARGGWERIFLVTNANGHYHREMSCSTCFPTTQFAWIPELSDHTEDEMIAKAGHMACTVCYPNAPVHPAFIQGLKDAEAEAAAKATHDCPGTRAEDIKWTVSPWGRCVECGQGVSVTKTGLVRKHKTRLGEHLAKRAKQVPKDAKAFNRLHTAALKLNTLADAAGGMEGVSIDNYNAWDMAQQIIKERERRARTTVQ